MSCGMNDRLKNCQIDMSVKSPPLLYMFLDKMHNLWENKHSHFLMDAQASQEKKLPTCLPIARRSCSVLSGRIWKFETDVPVQL